MHDFDMQTDNNKQNNAATALRVFLYSAIDPKDEVEEKLDRARNVLGKLVANLSEREAHDMITNASFQSHKHDEICLGLLGNILTDPSIAVRSFRDLNLISRDLTLVMETLSEIIINKYQKLSDISRSQCLWLIKELVKVNANGAEALCWNMMRQIAGGDISGRNLWLSETMLDIYSDNSGWLDKYPVLIAAVIYTYLRLLEDHTPAHLSNLRQKEVHFVVNLIRDHFTDVIINQQIGLGRDFLRLLQAVSKIPEIEALWKDIYFNPKALSPHLGGVVQLLNLRTSRKYLQLRITPDMEKKLGFLTANVKFGLQKRYQEWFQRQYLSTPESQTLRADLIRFIVGVIHPPNEILCSDILPRWAVIGWLLTTCTHPVAAANAKLALFYDWLLFDPAKDNIMNIEPGILVMHHSLKPHIQITTTLLDFLIRLTYEYWPAVVDKIRLGISAAFKTILLKKVLPSLDFILENPKFEPELRSAIQEHLIVLLDRNNGTKVPDVINMGIVSSTNNNSENHVMEDILSSTTPSANANLSSTLNAAISTALSYSNSNTITLRASPPPAPSPSTPVSVITSSINANAVSSTTSINNPPAAVPQSNTINSTSTTFNLGSDRIKIEQPDADFSDDDDDYAEGSQADLLVPRALAGAVPARSSPTLGSSVDEAERSKIFEFVQILPPNMRIAVEALMNETSSLTSSRKENLDDIIEEISDNPLEDETKDCICKCFLYIFKSELSKSCVNEETSSVIDNFTITPVSELLNILIPIKLSDKSVKMKNITRVLVELINAIPPIAYKILIMLHQKKDAGKFNSRREENFATIYKNLAQTRGIKFEQQLLQDMQCCWENDQIAVGYLCPIFYNWYENECQSNSFELLKLITSSIDAGQLQDIVWKVMREDVELIRADSVGDILLRSFEWESWEQHCLWTLVDAHDFSTEEFVSIIPNLDSRKNSEALTALLMILKKSKPNKEIVGPLLCRKPSQRDFFVQSLLLAWANASEDELAEVLAEVLVRTSSSPVKRKRGPTGGRGTASPGGPPTPSLETVLGHLDQLRDYIGDGEEGVFTKDIMQAALLQVQLWVNDSQKNKYRELLALAAEEPDTKESRNLPKRSTAPRKLPSSPTPSGTSSSSSAPKSTNSSSTTSTTATGSSSSGSNLSRTRSGRTRAPMKDDSSESSEDDDDVPRPKKVKRRKNYSDSESD